MVSIATHLRYTPNIFGFLLLNLIHFTGNTHKMLKIILNKVNRNDLHNLHNLTKQTII